MPPKFLLHQAFKGKRWPFEWPSVQPVFRDRFPIRHIVSIVAITYSMRPRTLLGSDSAKADAQGSRQE
jgi:hypothetical protein